jgi:hypothetical protein
MESCKGSTQTQVGFSLAWRYETKVEVTDSDKTLQLTTVRK